MSRALLLLCLLDFALIGALPRLFFRRGRLNLRWWATAAPLFAMAAVLCAALAGAWPARYAGGWPVVLVAVPASMALIGVTLATHRVPLALWHQADDRAAVLVTHGPYRYVRHPFYTAFLLALLAAAAAAPGWITAAIAAAGAFQLCRTAVGEERRLVAQFGAEYQRYMETTGRFWPRMRNRR